MNPPSPQPFPPMGTREKIRAIAFDAVGTLLYPRPSAVEVYAEAAGRFGLPLDLAEVQRRFRQAWTRRDDEDRANAWRTSETREHERWRRMVAEVFAELADTGAVFDELWQHFASANAWQLFHDAIQSIPQLGERQLHLAIASNFDARLRTIVAGISELAACKELVISSEVGWRKPAAEFFAALCRRLDCEPKEVLLVGDDWENDCVGGRSAGLSVVFLNRGLPGPEPSITSLRDLPGLLA